MTKKEKEEKLAQLDENVLDLLIKHTGYDGDTSLITELSVAVNFLKSNEVVSEKARSTVDDGIKKRVAEAKKRRDSNAST